MTSEKVTDAGAMLASSVGVSKLAKTWGVGTGTIHRLKAGVKINIGRLEAA